MGPPPLPPVAPLARGMRFRAFRCRTETYGRGGFLGPLDLRALISGQRSKRKDSEDYARRVGTDVRRSDRLGPAYRMKRGVRMGGCSSFSGRYRKNDININCYCGRGPGEDEGNSGENERPGYYG